MSFSGRLPSQSPWRLVSLLVSLTIVPVLAYWFLRGGRNQQPAAQTAGEGDGPTAEAEGHTAEETKVTRLQQGYLPILRFGLRQPFITLGAALVVFVATLGAATFLKTDFLGSVTDQTTLAIQQELPLAPDCQRRARRPSRSRTSCGPTLR